MGPVTLSAMAESPFAQVFRPSRVLGGAIMLCGVAMLAGSPFTALFEDPAWSVACMGLPLAGCGIVMLLWGWGFFVARVELGDATLRVTVPKLWLGLPVPPVIHLDAARAAVTEVRGGGRMWAVHADGRAVLFSTSMGLRSAKVAEAIAAWAGVRRVTVDGGGV